MISKQKLLIATHNKAKFAEIAHFLQGIPYQLVSLADLGIDFDVEETGATYEENAILKATTYCALSGLPTVADDSGMEIQALNGEPGLYTKRYLGECLSEQEKREKLLEKMAHIPASERGARFVCVMALAWPDGSINIYNGYMPGAIATSMRGTPVPQFPYWNLFEHIESKKTCSELRDEGREPATHRAVAMQNLVNDLL